MLYKNYNQAALDRQYNVRLHTPDFNDYFEKWERLSRETEKKLSVNRDISYGELTLEQLDIYPSSQQHSKVLVFIHGGYWQMLDKSNFHFVANTFCADNITTVLLNYPLAPDYTMDQIVLSCSNAISWVYNNIATYNGDPNQIYIAGHSAGGHLATMMMTTQWSAIDSKLPLKLIKGVCSISGLSNLVPIQLCYQNNGLRMDMETAIRNSPVSLGPLVTCPLLIAVGGGETEEFIDQSRELEIAWNKTNDQIKLIQVPGKNHYSIMDEFINKDTAIVKGIHLLMKV